MRKSYFVMFIPLIIAAQSSSTRGYFAIGGFDPRAVAIGGSYVAMEAGAASTYWNPAGLGFMKGKEVRIIYSNIMQNMVNQTFLAYGEEDKGNGAYGLAIFNRMVNPSYLTDGTNSYMSAETFAALSYAKKTSRFLSLGFTVKWYNVYANFDSSYVNSGNGFGLDFGVRYRPQKIVSFGMIVRDLPGMIIQAGSRERMSVNYELGMAYSPLPLYKVLTFAVSAAGIEDNATPEKAGFGFEWVIAKIFTLRAGITKYIDAEQTTSGAIGIGFFKKTKTWDIAIDYGFQGKDKNLGLNHRASVGIMF